MKQLTITIPDDFYQELMLILSKFPEVKVNKNEINEVTLWQQEIVLDRIKNSKQEDYIDAKLAIKSLKKKYEITK